MTIFRSMFGHSRLSTRVWENPRQLQSHFGAFGPEIPKESKTSQKKSLPGPPVPGVQKVLKESKKSQKRVKKGPFWLVFDSFWTLLGLFDPWDQRARETLSGLVFDSFGISGPKGPRWLCSWRGFSFYHVSKSLVCPTFASLTRVVFLLQW